MTPKLWQRARQSRTLLEAHKALSALRPATDAPLSVWRTYYRQSAAIYAEVAEIDRAHHHEALYWSRRELQRAETLTNNTN
ncbi:AMED_5909 family protein [Saccharomonospora sp. NPDC006951]